MPQSSLKLVLLVHIFFADPNKSAKIGKIWFRKMRLRSIFLESEGGKITVGAPHLLKLQPWTILTQAVRRLSMEKCIKISQKSSGKGLALEKKQCQSKVNQVTYHVELGKAEGIRLFKRYIESQRPESNETKGANI